VGRRDPRPEFAAGYRAVIAHPLDRTVGWSRGLVPAVETDDQGERVPPEVYGRPCIAGGTLLVPTREALFRFRVDAPPLETVDGNGELSREIASLPAFAPVPQQPLPEDEVQAPPMFGNLVAIDGVLYAVTGDRVICYGPAPK
jgi:hypothetical protein